MGQTYKSQSPTADPEECLNFYAENVEGTGKSSTVLYPTPGLSLFCTLPTGPLRGEFYIDGLCYAVGGGVLYQVFANGTFKVLGNVLNDGLPASMCAGPTQLAVASGGVLFVFNYTNNTFSVVPVGNFPSGPISQIGYSDGFFIAVMRNSNIWQVSALEDATTWPPLATTSISVFPENIVSMVVDHRDVWIFGNKKSVVYTNAGAPIFPYAVIPGALMETGSVATYSAVQLDNSIFVLGGDERGAGIVSRTSGYGLQRVSTFAVEYAIQQYVAKFGPTALSTAVAYSYQDSGHSFYMLRFPLANATWCFDVATGLWHKRSYWNAGTHLAHLSTCHAYAFGQHLVGDWNSGNIYVMSIQNLTDNGNVIRRERVAPPISTENQWIFFSKLEIDLETGLGPIPPLLDGNGDPREPQLQLSWTGDNGHTWSNEHTLNCGAAGQYKRRAIRRRMGKDRTRSFKIVCTDPIPWRIAEAYLTASGFSASERIAAQYRKVA